MLLWLKLGERDNALSPSRASISAEEGSLPLGQWSGVGPRLRVISSFESYVVDWIREKDEYLLCSTRTFGGERERSFQRSSISRSAGSLSHLAITLEFEEGSGKDWNGTEVELWDVRRNQMLDEGEIRLFSDDFGFASLYPRLLHATECSLMFRKKGDEDIAFELDFGRGMPASNQDLDDLREVEVPFVVSDPFDLFLATCGVMGVTFESGFEYAPESLGTASYRSRSAGELLEEVNRHDEEGGIYLDAEDRVIRRRIPPLSRLRKALGEWRSYMRI
ncbi:MAG: hypothetical protein AAGJ31_02550 [Verrucomicrobiota bacterium]